MPIRINNYEEFKKPLDATTETDITFEEKGDDFVFEVDGKEYSLSKLNKNLIDVYQMENEKMNLIIKVTEEIENLKEDVKENIEDDKLIKSIDIYIDKFKERKKATKRNKKYDDGTSGLNLINDTAKKAIDDLKDKKKAIKRSPTGHKNTFNKSKYNEILETMGTIRDTATDSERPTENFNSHDLDDAERNNEYNKETIIYQEKFNGLLKILAADKFKIKDYANLTKYFQDVINGTIEHPEQKPFKCEHREDYRYLMSLRTKYPQLNIVVRDPDGNSETVDNDLDNNSDDDLDDNTENSENIEDLDDDSALNALKNGSIIDFFGSLGKKGLEAIGLDVNFTQGQKQTLKVLGSLGLGFLILRGVRKLRRKGKESKGNRKLWVTGAVLGLGEIVYKGHTKRSLFGDTFKVIFGSGSVASRKFGGFFEGFNFNKIDEKEEKSEKKPKNLMYAAGRATPSNKLFKTKNGKFEVDYPMFEQQVATLPDDMKEDAINSMEKFMKEDDTNASINKTMAMFGISVEDYEDPKNKDKTLVDIANDQQESKGRVMKDVEEELKEKGYEIRDEGRYNIYLDWDPKDDDIDEKLKERKEKDTPRVKKIEEKIEKKEKIV